MFPINNIFNKKKLTIISGIIGVGKTTLCNNLSKLNYNIVYEPFEDNPFLKKMYESDNKSYNYCFHTQVNFFYSYVKNLLKYNNFNENIIFDRYIYESVFIFSKLFYDTNKISFEEYELLLKLFELFNPQIQTPDQIIFLYCDENIALQRIKKRGRIMEQNISIEYLQSLTKLHIDFFNDFCKKKNINVVTLDVSYINEETLLKNIIKYL